MSGLSEKSVFLQPQGFKPPTFKNSLSGFVGKIKTHQKTEGLKMDKTSILNDLDVDLQELEYITELANINIIKLDIAGCKEIDRLYFAIDYLREINKDLSKLIAALY